MDKNLKAHIEYLLCIDIEHVRPISGGDISKAFLLETNSERFFCKVNNGHQAFQMFQAEKAGLEAISKTKCIAVPNVFICEELEVGGLLLMEYIEPKRASSHKDMELLGRQLGALHRLSVSDVYGWPTDNFIGNLPQSNKTHTTWSEFYVQERLLPQIRLAQKGRKLSAKEIPSEGQLRKACENLFPKIKPSLLHGDLWGGNYLIAQDGTPYLIDPATYFGHREIDIAMTRLFGGFDATFYNAYAEYFPEIGGEKERTDIYQLYYLLVHLNLFGGSYKASVSNILNHYF